MGEYAKLGGRQVKIGTCEDLYYLRADQVGRIDGYTFNPETLAAVRFRFPFPDEDDVAPGGFDPYDRGLTLWGFEQPAEIEHGTVQFTARNGYLTSLQCPEGPEPQPFHIHRNGYGGPAALIQQAWRGGRMVGVARCNGCRRVYRLEDGHELAAAVSIRAQADEQIAVADRNGTEGNRDVGRHLHEIADRLLAGYEANARNVAERQGLRVVRS